MNIDPLTTRPPKIAAILLVGAVAIHLLLRPERNISQPWNYIGILFIIDGFSLMYWAHQLFIKSGTPVPHDQQPTKFIREGLYQNMRNPMYMGALIIFVGIWIFMGTWPFFLIAAVLFFILDRVYVPWEENRMEDLFGEDYINYKKKTRRWM